MLTFKYVARNPTTGEKISAVVQADSQQAAAKLIRNEGLTPIDIQLDTKGVKGFGSKLKKVKARDRVLFSRQLSTLIDAGLPLVQSLHSVNDQTTNKPLKAVISQVINDVEGGSTLAVSMSKHPKVFNKIYLSMISAGETSGTLDESLNRLALQQEKDADLTAKIRGAMIYPLIVLVVMFGVLGFMLVKVLPQVQQLYSGLPGSKLPLLTTVLLSISHFIITQWWVVLIISIVIGVLVGRWAVTAAGRSAFDTLKMKAWPVAPLFMKMYMARFARTGSTLISSGVPLIQMLDIAGNAVSNVHIQASITLAIEKVKGGKSLADSLTNDPNFLPLVPNMLKIGEESGAMEEMMGKTADYFEKEVDNQVKSISTIIEPVLMVILGVVAFIIVAAVLLPIYGLANNSSAIGG